MNTNNLPGHHSEQAITLAALIAQAPNWDAQFSELAPSPTRNITIDGDFITFDKTNVRLDQEGRNQLLAQAGAPVSYLAERSIDIQILALIEHLRQGSYGTVVTPVVRFGKLFTLHTNKLAELTHAEILRTVWEALGDNAASLVVTKIDRSDTRLELELISPVRSIEARLGDIIHGGVHIRHSRYLGEATQIWAFIYRLACENGMLQKQCVAQGIVRTRKPLADHPNAKEMLLDQIRRLTEQTWERLEPQMREFQATTKRRVEVVPVLQQFLQRARISTKITDSREPDDPTIMDRILAAWRMEGGEDTYYGAVNALTRVGTHDRSLSARQRRTLILLAGLIAYSGAHICPRCFSLLSGPPHQGAAVEAAA